ncbi:MAG TPA: tetratricopeptide repeat protein [Steroidobacteraceae bacterium]|nr:tetratricopeptide repeat protein [Steroidobacteraceae bacterium]
MSPMRTTRALALTAIVAVALLITGCGGAKSRLASHMKRGQAYYQSGDFAKAGVEFRNAMQIDPKDAQARIMAAQTSEKLGQLRNAYGLLQSVIEEHPDNLVARTALGRLLITAGEPKQGLEIIKPALAKQPDDATLLAMRGAAESALKDPAAGRADAERAVTLDPKNEDAVDLRAALYRQDGNLPAAIKLVRDAAAAQPAIPGFHQVLVSLYQLADKPELAEAQLRALVKLNPDQLGYRAQLAVFLSRSKRMDEAQKVLEDAVKALPHSDDAKLLQVDFLAQARTHFAAEQTLSDYIKADSDNYTLRLALGNMLQKFNESAKAITVFNDIVKDAGTAASGIVARDRLAVIAVGEKREADAQRLLAEVLKASPRDNDALAIRGQLELARGDTTSAIADLRAVLRDQPRNPSLNRILAQALVAHGDMALAQEPLRAAVEAAPADASLRIALAQVLFQTQQPEQGLTVLQDAVKALPTDNSLNDALVRAYLSRKDIAGATKAADTYRDAKPGDAAPYLLEGVVAQADNRLDDAQAQFEKALAIQPHGYDVLTQLVHLQVQRGQGAKAVSRLQGLMAAEPKGALIPNLLGEIYLEQKNYAAAQLTLGVAIVNDPKWWRPHRNLALVKFAGGDLPGAIDAYQDGLKLAPTEVTLLNDLGSLYQRVGRIDDAQKLYDGWIARDPKSQVAANNLAMLLVSYHTDKTSLDRAQALTAGFANARSGDLLDTAGWVQFKRGDYTQALPVLQRAAELMPQSHEVHYHLGMAELRSGQADRARTDLETAVAGSSRFFGEEDARAALASLKSRAT